VSRLVTGIKCLIFIKRSTTIKICLYVLPLQRHLGRLITWLIEISVYRRTSSSSGFRKLGGAKHRVFIQKQRAQSFTKVAVNYKIPGHQ
jgi:hypothetical protein